MASLLDVPILVLSPHYDDAVLSCGGLLAVHSDAKVVTVFAKQGPEKSEGFRAKLVASEVRGAENQAAMSELGVGHQSLGWMDAPWRRNQEGSSYLYESIQSLFGSIHPEDIALCKSLEAELVRQCQPEERFVVAPLGVGAHVDHQLCAHAARRAQGQGLKVLFYEDAPYVFPDPGPHLHQDSAKKAARRLEGSIRSGEDIPIDLEAKDIAVGCYQSQVSALFGSMREYQLLVDGYCEVLGGPVERYHRLYFQR